MIAAFFMLSDQFLQLVKIIADFFEDIGFSTRVFDMFLQGAFVESEGRELLYSKIIDAIKENPIIGYGLMGDRPIIGFYVHNLFLEVLCHFGVALGSIILLLIVGIPCRALSKCRKTDAFVFILMLMCIVFVKLMFSGSYLDEPYLFFLIGVSISVNRRIESVEKQSNNNCAGI